MTAFLVDIDGAAIYVAPDLAAASVPVPRGTAVEAMPTVHAAWMEVTSMQGLLARTGFMRAVALSPVDQPPEPLPDDMALFFNFVDSTARDLGVDRDYLVAAVWAGTEGLTQIGTAAGPMMGPFMFTAANWQTAIASRRAPPGTRPDERRLWSRQVQVAAAEALDANDALTAAFATRPDPRPPTLGMLYFAHVFGPAAAVALLVDMARPFEAAYTTALGSAGFATCRAEHDAALGFDGATVHDVFDGLCRALDDGYVAASAVLDRQGDGIRFFHAEADDPRWMMVAREEAVRGVYEQRGADNNTRIVQYLRATGLAASTDEVPWCAAFVTFCMQQADLGGTVPHDPARAVSWLSWGREAPAGARAPGMVVVLKPQAAGHVGFLVQDATGPAPAPAKIRLLAGNQGTPQRVCMADFDEDKVREGGFRMLDGMTAQLPAPDPAPPEGGPVIPAGGVGGSPGTFRSLVAGGTFSADPFSNVDRSIRTNNPGALDWTSWQTRRLGYFGRTAADKFGNKTTIYLTPEHGIASWYTLLAVRYGLGTRFGLRTLGSCYAGGSEHAGQYVTSWVDCSHGKLTADSIIDTTDVSGMLVLAKAIFRNESSHTALHDDQIVFAITHERAGTLPP